MTSTTCYDGVLPNDLAPSARVVMVGAGELARMTHQAAIDYGISLHVLANAASDPAVAAGATHTFGNPDHYFDLAAVARYGQVVTFEHESVRVAHLRALEQAGHRLRPRAGVLAFVQDTLYARRQLASLGHLTVPMPAFAPATIAGDVTAFAAEHGWPVVLKARSGSRDGHGVHVLRAPSDASLYLPDTPAASEPVWVLEEYLELTAEFSILIARRPAGHFVSYPPVGTRRVEGTYQEYTIPARLPASLVRDATRLAESIVTGLDVTGVCAVKFFWITDGSLLLNELVLGPHDSGHVTIEACATSQFHQHLRAVLDWPLGATTLSDSAATVILIGGPHGVDPIVRLPHALAVTGASIHLYAKTSRPGRKLGHVTALGASIEDALETARAAAALLTQP